MQPYRLRHLVSGKYLCRGTAISGEELIGGKARNSNSNSNERRRTSTSASTSGASGGEEKVGDDGASSSPTSTSYRASSLWGKVKNAYSVTQATSFSMDDFRHPDAHLDLLPITDAAIAAQPTRALFELHPAEGQDP